MANVAKKSCVDSGQPKDLEPGQYAVTELTAHHAGADSPFGDIEFPVAPETLGYVHLTTVINK